MGGRKRLLYIMASVVQCELRMAGLPFTVSVDGDPDRALNTDAYSAAMAFIRGEIDISGDLISAIRFARERTVAGPFARLCRIAARLSPARLETWFQSRKRAAQNIRYHYDCSNEFYSKFLDSRMVYSSALFGQPDWPLERAQLAKLNVICTKLDLRRGDRFLDIGCGWGALVIHAAEQYRACASGCTLSHKQFEFAASAIAARGLQSRANVRETDYRNLLGKFHKIASIGMFEHVGRHRMASYFQTIASLLEDGGLFLNWGITRPQPVGDDAETHFLQERVFPGGELVHLSDIIRHAENAGFEVLELSSHRIDYARTCREWVTRLQENAGSCVGLVGEETYRVWLLYLACCAVNFEEGQTGDYAILMGKG